MGAWRSNGLLWGMTMTDPIIVVFDLFLFRSRVNEEFTDRVASVSSEGLWRAMARSHNGKVTWGDDHCRNRHTYIQAGKQRKVAKNVDNPR